VSLPDFQHSREFLPTAQVARAGPVAELPRAPSALAEVPLPGGMSATLRDLARFGQLLAAGGRSASGEQVLSAWWLPDTLTGDPGSRAAFAASPTDTRMPGGMYRNMCWIPYPDPAVLLCLGIYGQMVYVDTAAGVLSVKLSSWPAPQDPAMLSATLRAFGAITEYLAADGQRGPA